MDKLVKKIDLTPGPAHFGVWAVNLYQTQEADY